MSEQNELKRLLNELTKREYNLLKKFLKIGILVMKGFLEEKK